MQNKHVASSGDGCKTLTNKQTNKKYLNPAGDEAKQQKKTENTYN